MACVQTSDEAEIQLISDVEVVQTIFKLANYRVMNKNNDELHNFFIIRHQINNENLSSFKKCNVQELEFITLHDIRRLHRSEIIDNIPHISVMATNIIL